MKKRMLTNLFTGLMAAGMIATIPGMTNLAYAGTVGESGGIPIDEVHFPDRRFRTCVTGFDKDGNGTLSKNELDQVTEISFPSPGPGDYLLSIQGIEYFTNLEKLDLGYSRLDGLDLSHNLKLKELDWSVNSIPAKLDLSKNTDLEVLKCTSCMISDLDVSQNDKLKVLWCSANDISYLDLGNKTELEDLRCANNKLENLNLSRSTKLEKIVCSGNYLCYLDVSSSSQIEDFDFTNNANVLYYESNKKIDLSPYPQFDVSKISDNVGFEISGNDLVVKDGYNEISYKYDSGHGICEFSAYVTPQGEGNIAINDVNFPDESFRNIVKSYDRNNDQKLSLSERIKIYDIDISEKTIESLKGIEYFPKLKELDCGYNDLTELNLSENTELQLIDCAYNKLTELDLSVNTKVSALICCYNSLESLSLPSCTELNVLQCQSNYLTEININKNKKLETMYCNNNRLTSLNVSDNVSLKRLDCSNNQLTSLDLSKNIALEDYKYAGNPLTSIIPPGASDSEDPKPSEPTENEEIAINETNFPDELFRNYVKSNFDEDQNDTLSQVERDAVIKIEIHLGGQ